jgi:cytochrome c553
MDLPAHTRTREGPRLGRQALPKGPTARFTSRMTCTAGFGASRTMATVRIRSRPRPRRLPPWRPRHRRCRRRAFIQMLAGQLSRFRRHLDQPLTEASDGTCSGCHGSDAGGTPQGPSLKGGQWLWSDGSLPGLMATIEKGVPNPKRYQGVMPPLGGAPLTKQDIAAVSAYVWAISRPGTGPNKER